MFTVLGAGSLGQELAWLGSGESSLPALQMASFSLCPHMADRDQTNSFWCLSLFFFMLAKVLIYNTQYWQRNREKCIFRHHPLENSLASHNGTNRIMKAPPSGPHLMPNQLPKSLSPNTITLGLQHTNFGGTQLSSFFPWPPKIHVLLTCKIHSFHPDRPKSLNPFQYQL